VSTTNNSTGPPFFYLAVDVVVPSAVARSCGTGFTEDETMPNPKLQEIDESLTKCIELLQSYHKSTDPILDATHLVRTARQLVREQIHDEGKLARIWSETMLKLYGG
jgi:hypothetical protein